MANDLKRISLQHYKVMDLELMGLTSAQITKEVGLTGRQVRNVWGSAIYRGELAQWYNIWEQVLIA